MFNRVASLAEFEGELIWERPHAGLATARGRRVWGRRRGPFEEAMRTVIVANFC